MMTDVSAFHRALLRRTQHPTAPELSSPVLLSACLSARTAACLPVPLSGCLLACLHVCLPVSVSICLCLSVCVRVCVCVCICVSACLCVCLSICQVPGSPCKLGGLPVYPSVRPPVCPYCYQFAFVRVCLSVCLCGLCGSRVPQVDIGMCVCGV